MIAVSYGVGLAIEFAFAVYRGPKSTKDICYGAFNSDDYAS